MPGPFFHLWLAKRVYPDFIIAANMDKSSDRLLPYFCAGAVAPDIGFYPNGPLSFSKSVHDQGGTGKFLRELSSRAITEVDKAFMAGWALHVYADLAIHPLVDRAVKDLYHSSDKRKCIFWHMRLEWGIDYSLLESEESQSLFLLTKNLLFPLESADSLRLTERDVYGVDVSCDEIHLGYESFCYWIKIIPRMFFWPGTSVLGWFLTGLGQNTTTAVLRPRRYLHLLHQINEISGYVIQSFIRGYHNDFTVLSDEPFGSIYSR